MTRFFALLAVSAAFSSAAVVQAVREVTYGYSGDVVPTFDKGYLLSVERSGALVVYGPDGSLAFRRLLTSPEGRPCSILSSAIDWDRIVAVSVAYRDSQSRAGIYFLDLRGGQVGFIDTKLYLASALTFDSEHFLWSVGWQRDRLQPDSADTKDYDVVRKFARSGNEIGSFLARSQWKPRLEPGSSGGGYWHMAAAGHRIGAMLYEGTENKPEWIEWDLQGALLSRTPVAESLYGGRAFTSDGKLYARILTRQPGQQKRLSVLDTKTGTWAAVSRELPRDAALLLGADGKHLVFTTGTSYRLLSVAVE
jgi:hypothetical protein